MEHEVYKKENYVEVAIENFHDYIDNLTFSLQKYVDMFYNTLPDLYEETRTTTHHNKKCQEMSSFLYAESESLVSMKCKHFIYQAISVIQNKFDRLSTDIIEDDEVRTFKFSEEGYFYFLHELDRVDWSALSDRKYHDKNNHSIDEVCKFEEFKTKKLDILKMNKFTDDKITYNNNQLLIPLQTAYTKVIDTLHKMRTIADSSSNLYDIVMITREVINILLITYIAISYIEIIED
jgi:hypothetical protein